METIRNVGQILVAKDVARTDLTALSTTTPITSYSQLADGEIFLVTPQNFIVDNSTAYTDCAGVRKIKLVQRSGTQLLHSDVIDISGVVNMYCTKYTAPAEQVDYIGYNGTSYSLDYANNNVHKFKMIFKSDYIDAFMRRDMQAAEYISDASATQSEVAAGLAKSFIANIGRYAEPNCVKCERVYSGALSNALGTATCSVVNGSDKIVFSEDMTALVLADTIVRLGGTGAGTTPCYIVTGHDSGAGAARIYTIDTKYQGATETIGAGSVESAAAGGNWGLKLTGVVRTHTTGIWKYYKVAWDVLCDFGSATAPTVTHSTVASPGIGDYRSLREIEHEFQMNENMYRGAIPAPTYREDILSTETYDVLCIEYKDITNTGLESVESPKKLYIALATCTDPKVKHISAANNGISIVLDDWIVTNFAVPGVAAISSSSYITNY